MSFIIDIKTLLTTGTPFTLPFYVNSHYSGIGLALFPRFYWLNNPRQLSVLYMRHYHSLYPLPTPPFYIIYPSHNSSIEASLAHALMKGSRNYSGDRKCLLPPLCHFLYPNYFKYKIFTLFRHWTVSNQAHDSPGRHKMSPTTPLILFSASQFHVLYIIHIILHFAGPV